MPIKPENLARYPANWPVVRARIQDRARNRCEQCGVANGAWGYRVDGVFHRVNKRQTIEVVRSGREWVRPPFWLGQHRIIVIVCTTAHLDHQPENCSDENLRFWCQRCHLRYDHAHHQRNAWETRRAGKAIEMFPTELRTIQGRI
jgi:hypothetical protein